MKFKKAWIISGFLFFALSGISNAADVTIPNIFTPNTPAKADSVNENFSALELAVDDNASVISSLQSAYLATEYYSVSTVAFIPYLKSYEYNIDWMSVGNANGTSDIFYAPVNLPDGAVVTSFEAILGDYDASEDVTVHLFQVPFGSGNTTMATVESSGSSSTASYMDTSISPSVVDNLNNSYMVWLGLPTSSMNYRGAVIGFHRTLN